MHTRSCSRINGLPHHGVTLTMNEPVANASKRTDGLPHFIPHQPFGRATRDIREGFLSWRVWTELALFDNDQRYRRTVLGPLWITVNMAAFVVGMALVYSAIFKTDFATYLPYLTAGMIVWQFMVGLAGDAPTIFVQANQIINSMVMPLSVHVLRVILRHLIVLAHNLVVFTALVVLMDVPVTWHTSLVIPGLLLLVVTSVWVTLILATAGARYRDLQPIITNVLQLMFFLTPLIWHRDVLSGGKLLWVDYNPLYHLIEIVRAPLLGQAPTLSSYVLVVALNVVGIVAGFLFFRRFRHRIVYWL